jgi:hypothetical protein
MTFRRMNLPITNSRMDEEGRVRLMVIVRRLSLDVYTWPRWRWNLWAMWAVGVLWNMRLGRVEWQVRWR